MTYENIERDQFGALLAQLVETKANAKETKKAIDFQTGKIEAQALLAAILFAHEQNDYGPIATYIHHVKPGGLAKRIIRGVFPNHTYMVNPETKMGSMVGTNLPPEGDAMNVAALDVLIATVESGDTLANEQVKTAFPAPKVSAYDKLTAQLKGFVDQGKITKAQLSDIVASL